MLYSKPIVALRFILLLCFSFACLQLIAQNKNSAYQLHIRKATSPIVVDGEMNEEAWLNADVAKSFWQMLPMDTSRALVPTEVRMTYDNVNLYIIATCYKAKQVSYMVESLRRDWNFGKNDNFIFCLDPFEDRTNGLTFGANAAGAQYDGMLYEGGSNNLNWDNKWISSVKNY